MSSRDVPKFRKILNKLLKEDGNRSCADCGSKQPRWASTNVGVFLCIRCSGFHRDMGVHISKVKSVSLDTWPMDLVDHISERGNAWVNERWEAKMPSGVKPSPGDSDYKFRSFIRDKYERKKYYSEKRSKSSKSKRKKRKHKKKQQQESSSESESESESSSSESDSAPSPVPTPKPRAKPAKRSSKASSKTGKKAAKGKKAKRGKKQAAQSGNTGLEVDFESFEISGQGQGQQAQAEEDDGFNVDFSEFTSAPAPAQPQSAQAAGPQAAQRQQQTRQSRTGSAVSQGSGGFEAFFTEDPPQQGQGGQSQGQQKAGPTKDSIMAMFDRPVSTGVGYAAPYGQPAYGGGAPGYGGQQPYYPQQVGYPQQHQQQQGFRPPYGQPAYPQQGGYPPAGGFQGAPAGYSAQPAYGRPMQATGAMPGMGMGAPGMAAGMAGMPQTAAAPAQRQQQSADPFAGFM